MSRGAIAERVVIVLTILASLAMSYLSLRASQLEHAAWDRFRDEHYCQVMQHEGPPAGISTAPGLTTWACDGGKTYIRNDD